MAGEMKDEGWSVGDLAKCIDASWHVPLLGNPRLGEILMVSRMREGKLEGTNELALGLGFEGRHAYMFWNSAKFVKILPDRSADEIEVGIIAKIKDAAKQGALV